MHVRVCSAHKSTFTTLTHTLTLALTLSLAFTPTAPMIVLCARAHAAQRPEFKCLKGDSHQGIKVQTNVQLQGQASIPFLR